MLANPIRLREAAARIASPLSVGLCIPDPSCRQVARQRRGVSQARVGLAEHNSTLFKQRPQIPVERPDRETPVAGQVRNQLLPELSRPTSDRAGNPRYREHRFRTRRDIDPASHAALYLARECHEAASTSLHPEPRSIHVPINRIHDGFEKTREVAPTSEPFDERLGRTLPPLVENQSPVPLGHTQDNIDADQHRSVPRQIICHVKQGLQIPGSP